MKMRKKLAALLAVAMIASVMPMTAFAASKNRVNKTVTVEKDSVIKKGYEPILSIKMDDELTTRQSFYLNLDGAEWLGTEDLVKRFATGKAAVKTGEDNIFHFEVSGYVFEAHREGGGTIAVRLLVAGTSANGTETGDGVVTKITPHPSGNPNLNFEFKFPMAAKVTGAEAIVEVQMYDTTITNNKHLFAVSDGVKSRVIVGDAPAFYRSTAIAEIKLEETYAKSLSDVPEDQRWFTIELRDTDFTFSVNKPMLKGQRAYRGVEEPLVEGTSYKLSNDRTRLGIKITDAFKHALDERGNIVLSGVEVIADRDARDGDVKAVIESNKLFDKEIITIAKRGDYKTKLTVADDWKYEVVAGTKKDVTFKLSEELANSLMGSRPATFTFDQDVTINTSKTATSDVWKIPNADEILWGDLSATNTAKIEELIRDIEDPLKAADVVDNKIELYKLLNLYTTKPPTRPGKIALTADVKGFEIKGSDVDDLDKDEWSKQALKPLANRVHIADNKKSFTVDNFNLKQDKAGAYTITVPLVIPANVTGDIKVAVAGRGVTEEEIVILKAEAPVTVTTTGVDVKVGLKEIETTGKITIKETAAERLHQGKDIVLRIDDIDNGLKIKSFDYAVTSGDLLLEDGSDKWKSGDKTISVKRSSTEASTIEITNIVMFTDRTVPEGKYDLLVGGNAISDNTDSPNKLDEVVTIKDFINITTKNTEDISGSANKAEVKFVVGSTQYLVNGKEETMDAASYIKDSRTMVPVRYVAMALGVTADKVMWDQANQTATILADKVVQVKLGEKAMLINGAKVPMEAAAELTNERTFVPVASIARALGVEVVWDAEFNTATFNPAK